ncbi:molybdate transport system substrate-binding protein [Prosthecobacter debontii]|uniref:Molybdate transport system substrate-binding protein n=1 Tax=Prosthecobacter debontii TaxID=48467 RepID=A0A1T4XSF2_9BACT|nr:molybdate ABC transporter substrate-binding protein [Prosthecobacter debontii]SKA92490.1 molybdate transport system substrate-binding protein [Prosthecobacter debontii]
MTRKLILFCLVLAAGALVFFGLNSKRFSSSSAHKTLTVYCAAGLKRPVEELAAQYEKEFGVQVSLQFGGTGTLLAQLRVASQGDLFLAADEGAMDEAQKLKVIREVIPVALQHPVIVVARGNPKNIHTITDLERPDVRLALTNPEAASIGKITQRLLGARWTALASKAIVMKPSVTEVAADAKLGTVDATLIWDSLMPQHPELEMIRVPELSHHEEKACAAVLTSANSPDEALKFARYLVALDRGAAVFQRHGFLPAGSRAN